MKQQIQSKNGNTNAKTENASGKTTDKTMRLSRANGSENTDKMRAKMLSRADGSEDTCKMWAKMLSRASGTEEDTCKMREKMQSNPSTGADHTRNNKTMTLSSSSKQSTYPKT